MLSFDCNLRSGNVKKREVGRGGQIRLYGSRRSASSEECTLAARASWRTGAESETVAMVENVVPKINHSCTVH
jgi:hypothetical protein